MNKENSPIECMGRQRDRTISKGGMLWTVAAILIMLWLVGLAAGDTAGYLIHMPVFFAIVVMLIKIEADCSGSGSGQSFHR